MTFKFIIDFHCQNPIRLAAIRSEGNMAEWSKAPESGSGLSRRGFESHCCQRLFAVIFAVISWTMLSQSGPERLEYKFH